MKGKQPEMHNPLKSMEATVCYRFTALTRRDSSMVEHRFRKAGVVGSIPIPGPTLPLESPPMEWFARIRPEQRDPRTYALSLSPRVPR